MAVHEWYDLLALWGVLWHYCLLDVYLPYSISLNYTIVSSHITRYVQSRLLSLHISE